MATVTYTFVSRCAGGGHTVFDISVNGGATQRVIYETDDLRDSLSNLSPERQDILKLLILKAHMAGKTRAQIVTELASPVTVTL